MRCVVPERRARSCNASLETKLPPLGRSAIPPRPASVDQIPRLRKEDTAKSQVADKLPPLAPCRSQNLQKGQVAERPVNTQPSQRSKASVNSLNIEIAPTSVAAQKGQAVERPVKTQPSQRSKLNANSLNSEVAPSASTTPHQPYPLDDPAVRSGKPLPSNGRPPRMGNRTHASSNFEHQRSDDNSTKQPSPTKSSHQAASRASGYRRSSTPPLCRSPDSVPLPHAANLSAKDTKQARGSVQASVKSTPSDGSYPSENIEKAHASNDLRAARDFMSNDLRRVIDEEEVTYSWSRKKANPDLKQQDVPKEKRMPESPTPIGVEVQDGNLPAATADSGEPPADSRGKLPSRGKSPSQRREGPERNSSDASHNNARASKKISFDPKDLAVVASKAESKAPANGSRGRPTEAGKQQSHAIDLGMAQEAKGQRMTDCTQRPDVAAKVVAYDGGKVCLTTGAMSKACGRELLHWARGELSNELACLHIDDWSQGQITWPETAGSSVQNRFGLLAGMLADAALKRTHIASLRTDCFSGSPWEVMRKGVQAVLDMTRLEGSGNTILASEVENALVRLESCANVDGPAKQLEFSVQRELLRLFWTDATPNFAECELDDAWLLQFLAQTHQQVRDMASTTPLATLREQNEFLDNYLVRLLRLKRALVTLVDRWEKVDYYAVLGVSPTASDKEIKAAYRKACLRLHPDKGGDKTQFQQLQDAYAQILEERAKKDSEHAKKNPENGTGSNSGAGTNQKGSQQGGRSTGATKVSTCLQLENDPGSAKANAEMEQTSSADGEVAMAEQRLNELVESINGRVHSAEQAEAKVQRLKKDKGGVDALQAAQEAGKTMLALSEELGTLGDTFSEAVMEVAESSLALAARFAMIPSAMLLTDVALSCTFEASRIQHAAHQLKEVRRDTVSTLQTLDTNLSLAKIIGSIDTETFKLSLGLVAKATSRIISSIRSAAVAVKDATTRGRQCKVHAKAVVAFASGRSAADLEAEDVTVHGALPAPETCNVPQDPEVPSEQAPPKAETEASPAEERNGASGQKPENALPNEWSAAVQGQVQNHRLFQQINADLMALQQRARAHLSKCGKAQQLADVPASDCDLVFQLVGEVLLAATEKTIGELDTAHASADIFESLLSRHFAFVERCGSSLASTLDLRTQLVRLAALLDAQAVIVALEKEVKPRLASHCGSAEKELHASLFSSLDRQFELLCSAVVAARLP